MRGWGGKLWGFGGCGRRDRARLAPARCGQARWRGASHARGAERCGVPGPSACRMCQEVPTSWRYPLPGGTHFQEVSADFQEVSAEDPRPIVFMPLPIA